MTKIDPAQLEFLLLEEMLWLAVLPTDVPSYDFAFHQFFACRRPWAVPHHITAIGRFGVSSNYAEIYDTLLAQDIRLIHSPDQYLLASELPRWYPRLEQFTPRSLWFDDPPPASTIEQHLNWPVFIKGARQTSRKRAAFSIVSSASEYEQVTQHYRSNPALHAQQFVCREFVPLRQIEAEVSDRIPPAFEFRTFWWENTCVGAGPYWGELYEWTAGERREALALAGAAAEQLNLPFVVIDVAQTAAGEWIIIECNDGQESGYAAISPFALWQNILDRERKKND